MNSQRLLWLAMALLVGGCGSASLEITEGDGEEPFDDRSNIAEQGLVSCNPSNDTGYTNGTPFSITVVSADGRRAEIGTANAYSVMQAAARNNGVHLRIVSGFRTMSEQQYLYGCYINKNCNGGNLAARPGYSNHQSGHALDLNTSEGGVLGWLNAHGGAYGFKRTVPSEPWHWEWWGGGPGGGPCNGGGGGVPMTPSGCTTAQAQACGNFGCSCASGACSGGFCAGNGCSAGQTQACGNFGCGCVDGKCSGGFCDGSGSTAKNATDCGNFGCNSVDGQCSGGFCPGTGCTAKQTNNCAAFGCGCVDQQCSGGFCPGTGSTAKMVNDCGSFGCKSIDGKCSGGFCEGSGCTAKMTNDCSNFGCGCVDGKCAGGFCPGTGCTAKQTNDCTAQGKACSVGKCT